MSQKVMQQALEALEWNYNTDLDNIPACEQWAKMLNETITALRAALAELDSDYERGFVDGMNMQTKRSVDKAVNRMAQNPFGDDAERYARKLREEREVRNLADYEFKTYKIGGFQLEAGFYSADELRDLIKAFDKMNAVAERSMRRKK